MDQIPFNSRIYSGDGQIHFSGQHLGNGRRIGRISFNEEGLDADKLAIRNVHSIDKMNRAIFEAKPINMDYILDSSHEKTLEDHIKRNKEQYCQLHQKFERTRDMQDLIGKPALARVINEDKKEQIRKQFELTTTEQLKRAKNQNGTEYSSVAMQRMYGVPFSVNQEGFSKSPQKPIRNVSINPYGEVPDMRKNKMPKEIHKAITKEGFKDSVTEPFSGKPFKDSVTESFTSSFTSSADNAYRLNINSNIHAILNIINGMECFNLYRLYWRDLKRNLDAHHWNINILDSLDDDIAYSLNKGEELNFKTNDNSSYLPYKIMIYVICHELAHVACNKEVGHTETFIKIMHIIEVAAFIAGLLRPKDFPIVPIRFSNQSVVSKDIVKFEIEDGVLLLMESNRDIDYLSSILNYIRNC